MTWWNFLLGLTGCLLHLLKTLKAKGVLAFAKPHRLFQNILTNETLVFIDLSICHLGFH
jgi:hypothetical protein